MDFAVFLVQCLNALQYGLLLFLVASGLTLIFGILGVINLAHGSFYMIGAYLAYALAPWAAQYLGGGFFTALAIGLVLSVVFGYLLEWGFISYLYQREHLQQVLMTYGLILVFEELRSILVGDDVHGVAPPAWLAGSVQLGGVMTYPVYRLFMSGVCVLVALGLYLVISRTRIGMAIRAGASPGATGAGIAMSPRRRRRGNFATKRARARASAGDTPLFVVSPLTFTCTHTISGGRPSGRCSDSRRATFSRSSECTQAN